MVAEVIEPMACDGLRTICIAYKDFKSGVVFCGLALVLQREGLLHYFSIRYLMSKMQFFFLIIIVIR